MDEAEFRDRISQLERELETTRRNVYAPGVLRCAKCEFRMVRTNLHVATGTAGPGDSRSEPCPNGCGPLWPVTWREEAIERGKQIDAAFELGMARGRRAVADLVQRLCEAPAPDARIFADSIVDELEALGVAAL